MPLSIRGKFVVGFDGEEHRLLWDGVVVEERRVRHVGKTYQGEVDRWIARAVGTSTPISNGILKR